MKFEFFLKNDLKQNKFCRGWRKTRGGEREEKEKREIDVNNKLS
jgi:hypothetical protein